MQLYRKYIIVFSFEKGRGNCEYRTVGRLTFDDIHDLKKEIAKENNLEAKTIIIENIIELK